MITEPRFFKCSHCQNLASLITTSSSTPYCCHQKMIELPQQAPYEKNTTHLLQVTQRDCTLLTHVGIPTHPMTSDHFIEWIYLQTTMGGVRRFLDSDAEPSTSFFLYPAEKPLGIYCYCHVHGLYKMLF